MAAGWLTFHLTDRCQLDCQHCLRDPGKTPRDLPLDLFERVLREARALFRSSHVALTGGEPTLHPGFARALDVIVAEGYTWHAVSNGKGFSKVVRLLEEAPARRASMTSFNFSLDGADEEVHDGIRGAGSFREVMSAVSLCTAEGIGFSMQMALHARNVHHIEQLGMLAAQLGAKSLSFVMLQATGTHHDQALYLSPRAWRSATDRIDRLASVLKLDITTPEGFYREQPLHVCEPFALQQLSFDVDGRLNLCCQHTGIPGSGEGRDVAADLHEVSLAEAQARLLTVIHDTLQAKVAAIARGGLGEWDHFPCNWCMKHFGKPHWGEGGAEGAAAKRERWRGAWGKKPRLPIVG